MSNSLGLHDPTLVRVFKLNNTDTFFDDLQAFIREKIALIVFGSFEGDDYLIPGANKMCLESSDNQAVLWIKDQTLMEKVGTALAVDTEKWVSIIFKRNSDEIAYKIERNPEDSLFKISLPEISFAFEEGLSMNSPLS